MNGWGRSTYGDPCRECGYVWSIALEDALTIVAEAPAAFAALVRGGRGDERCAGLDWNTTGYISHVGDNLRIWAERMAAAAGASGDVVPYDSDALGFARRYNELPLRGALWHLGEASTTWRSAWTTASEAAVVLVHPDRGPISMDDIARTNAHDVHHHQWDVTRCMGTAGGGPSDRPT